MSKSRFFCACAISIHALREEGDNSYKDSGIHTYLFQSTPSARRATGDTLNNEEAKGYFNPRPPRGGRLCPVPPRDRSH